ncbi:MAG: 4'-phosphopantetheinyl transferase superfamily protein [Elainellaceae cyanobacterium]
MSRYSQTVLLQELPVSLELTRQDIHLWFVSLDRPLVDIQPLQQVLSPDEQARADRFYSDRHRFRFIVGRGVLRLVLASYIGLMPEQIQFSYSEHGKPALANASVSSAVSFNLSHSANHALYAITCDRLVGVDLEHLRSIDNLLALAKRFFTSNEYARLSACSPADQTDLFFQLWTCKEAYLKAIGEGLAGLAQVEVRLSPDRAASLYLQGSEVADAKWTVLQLAPHPSYAAALATPGEVREVVNYAIG